MPFFTKPKPQQNPQEVLAELRQTLRRAGNDAVDAGAHLREIARAFEDATQNVKMELARDPRAWG